MDMEQGLFAIKLHELDQSYGQMVSRLQILQSREHNKISSEIEKMKDESLQADLTLKMMADHSRSPAAASLAKAQQRYAQDTEQCLAELMAGRTDAADRADAMTLYAEYAIDFAVLSTKYALLTALSAMDLQMEAEEQNA